MFWFVSAVVGLETGSGRAGPGLRFLARAGPGCRPGVKANCTDRNRGLLSGDLR